MNIDTNAIAASAAAELTKQFFSDLKKTSLDFFSRKYSYLFEDFSNYLELTFNRCNLVRTIINKDKSFELDEIYVPGTFRINEETIRDIDLIQSVRDGKPAVVLGFGGIGKTVFTKYLWLSIFREPMGKIPVFLEVRKLNNITDIDVKTYIRRTISPGKGGVDEATFDAFLNDGRFVFVFDGYDELSESRKVIFGDEILELSYTYPSNGFLISSRHDDRFNSWQRFDIYKACPFSKGQVLTLIKNIPYDKETKKKFISDIIEKKYDSYNTFLATPLLTLMMLMTFSQFAEVPDKRHIFYRYAFMTLYSWHDSSKESFNREKQTGLLLDQFEQAFSTFCLISYLGGNIEFDESEIVNYIDKVKRYLTFDFSSKLFLSEITDTVNLMYKDGDKFLFTHRSFQEYFSAYAAINFFQNKMVEIVPRIHRGSDMVLGLMYEINRAIVDENYIVPEYEKHKIEIAALLKCKTPDEFCREAGIVYVAGFSVNKRGTSQLSMFGSNVAAPSWKYVWYLKAFFESDPGMQSLTQPDRFNAQLMDEIRKATRSAAKKSGSEYFVAVYDVGTNVIKIVPKQREDFAMVHDLIEAALVSEISVPVKAATFSATIERDGQYMKSVYVLIDKMHQQIKQAYVRKEKSIDELLS
jgi:hypothetical protein